MRIVVCCKAVPAGLSNIRYDEAQDKIEYDSYAMIMNESDECALEEALRIKKDYGAEVIVLTVGGLTAQEILTQSLAKGADRVIRINAESTGVSKILAHAIRLLDCDLVLTGVESSDGLSAQTGVAIAGKLSLPHAFVAVDLEYDQGQDAVKATSELGQGVHEVVELPLPALVCVQSTKLSINKPSVMKILQARKKPVESMTLESLGLGQEPPSVGMKMISVFDPPPSGSCEIIQGNSPQEISTELIRRIYAVSK